MRRALDELVPVCGRVDVDLHDTGVGCYAKTVEARVSRWLVALHDDGLRETARRGLDRCDQLEVVLEPLGRWHEYVQHAIASLCTQGGPRYPVSRLPGRGGSCWVRAMVVARARRTIGRGVAQLLAYFCVLRQG